MHACWSTHGHLPIYHWNIMLRDALPPTHIDIPFRCQTNKLTNQRGTPRKVVDRQAQFPRYLRTNNTDIYNDHLAGGENKPTEEIETKRRNPYGSACLVLRSAYQIIIRPKGNQSMEEIGTRSYNRHAKWVPRQI